VDRRQKLLLAHGEALHLEERIGRGHADRRKSADAVDVVQGGIRAAGPKTEWSSATMFAGSPFVDGSCAVGKRRGAASVIAMASGCGMTIAQVRLAHVRTYDKRTSQGGTRLAELDRP
jgi:hypothetical protein